MVGFDSRSVMFGVCVIVLVVVRCSVSLVFWFGSIISNLCLILCVSVVRLEEILGVWCRRGFVVNWVDLLFCFVRLLEMVLGMNGVFCCMVDCGGLCCGWYLSYWLFG